MVSSINVIPTDPSSPVIIVSPWRIGSFSLRIISSPLRITLTEPSKESTLPIASSSAAERPLDAKNYHKPCVIVCAILFIALNFTI